MGLILVLAITNLLFQMTRQIERRGEIEVLA